jgi:hypothetical protein
MKRRDALKSMVAMAALPVVAEAMPVKEKSFATSLPFFEVPGFIALLFIDKSTNYSYFIPLAYRDKISTDADKMIEASIEYRESVMDFVKSNFRKNEQSYCLWTLNEAQDRFFLTHFQDHKKINGNPFDLIFGKKRPKNSIECQLTSNGQTVKLTVERAFSHTRTSRDPLATNLNDTQVIDINEIVFKKVKS